jgi:hypothetical protein
LNSFTQGSPECRDLVKPKAYHHRHQSPLLFNRADPLGRKSFGFDNHDSTSCDQSSTIVILTPPQKHGA